MPDQVFNVIDQAVFNSSSNIPQVDIIDVAKREIGYQADAQNRTKYSEWYGMNGAPWCQMFVSWCAYQASVSTDIVPRTASTTEGMNWFVKKQLFRYKGSYTPDRGDLIYFKSAGASHVGLVEYSDGARVYTIEGNNANAVRRSNYSLEDKTITGYGVPEYKVLNKSESIRKSTYTKQTAGNKQSTPQTPTQTVSGTVGTKIKKKKTTEIKKTSKEELAYLKRVLTKHPATKQSPIKGKVVLTNNRGDCSLNVIISTGKKVFTVPVINGAKLVYERKCAPGKFTFSAVLDKRYLAQEGNAVLVILNNRKIFYGFIFKISMQKDNIVSYTVYDQIRYLKNSDIFVYKKKTADDLIRLIAKRFGLQTGKLDKCKYVIKKATVEDATMIDTIQDAIDKEMMEVYQLYVLWDDIGKLRLTNVKNMKVNDCLIDADTAEDYEFSSSIDQDVYNQIKLYYVNKKKGKYETYIARDKNSINKWGLLQKTEQVAAKDSAKMKAEAYLKLYNKETRTLRFSGVIGNANVRGGSMIPVVFNVYDTKIATYMLVDKVTHTFENGRHYMDLNVSGGDFDSQ